MKKFTPLIKGIITGAVMVAFNLFSVYLLPAHSSLGYLMYLIYAAGIAWTLFDFSKSPKYTGKFKELFGQGFRCFIIVTLMMVIYSIIFVMTHPEMKEEYAVYAREELVKQKNKTPVEIEEGVKNARNQFVTVTASQYLFGYLIPGIIFTIGGSALFIQLRNKSWT
jgi:hypothetical protein